eukprot:6472919-Amphidinium_carterae.1
MLDPFAYHGVEPIYSGRRYSLSVFSAAGLPRVPRYLWNQLRSAGFPVKSLQKKYDSPLSLLINMVQQFGPQDAEEVVNILDHAELGGCGELHRDVLRGETCYWFQHPPQMDQWSRSRLQHSLKKLNAAGAVICRVHNRQCLEELAGFSNLANESQIDMFQLPTIMVFPGDTVDPLETTFDDEIQTLPKAVRKEILKQTPTWYVGDAMTSEIPSDLEIMNFPQYEEAEEVLDEADDDEDTTATAVEWTPS